MDILNKAKEIEAAKKQSEELKRYKLALESIMNVFEEDLSDLAVCRKMNRIAKEALKETN